MNGGSSASGESCAGISVFEWERFAGMEGTRGSVSKTGSLSSRAFADCKSDERNMEATSRGLRRAVEPMHGTSSVGSAGDSGAHWKRDSVQGIGMMFHVKQT